MTEPPVAPATLVSAAAPARASLELGPARAMAVPFAFACALAGTAWWPLRGESARLFASTLGAAGLLGAWAVILGVLAAARGKTFELRWEARKQHFIQACAQSSVLVFWGWYWPEVYRSVSLIVAQLLFAYGFDVLLAWSRRRSYTLGFAPFPVIFSINLFMWFRPDWFFLQFAMVAVGIGAKELIHWQKEGRRAHIFNPSSFPLALVSVALLAFHATGLTWARQIAATQSTTPHFFLVLFLVGLAGQYLFGVTTMTMSAAVSMYVFGVAYTAITGSNFLHGDIIPGPVFLGMMLLFTDPSTAPRSELGRIFFGVLYAAAVLFFARTLEEAHLPGFYDKLLPVPLLNLTIQLIDRAAGGRFLSKLDPARLGKELPPQRRRLAYIGIWAIAFAVMDTYGFSAIDRRARMSEDAP